MTATKPTKTTEPNQETERLLRGILYALRTQVRISRDDAIFLGNSTKATFCTEALEQIDTALGGS